MLESEIAFVITKKSLDITRDIAGITSIRGYELKPKPRLRITDTYYDTKSGSLGKKKIGLRTRSLGGTLLISIKSNPQRVSGMGLRRNEFEGRWSWESLGKIARALGLKGDPPEKSIKLSLGPSSVLAKMGLKIVQQRHSTRDVRDILYPGKSGARRIAELDIDRVTFLGDPPVKIFEVEIEAKAPRSLRRIQTIAAELESNYSGFLRVWPHGKLVTGLAIQSLSRKGGFRYYLDDGKLRPEAFDVLDRAIAAGRVKDPTG